MDWPTTDEELIEKVVLVDEGGFVNNPDDAGGPTNMGITMATLAAWRGHPVTIADVENLQRPEAIQIYQKKYITDLGFDKFTNLPLRTQLVDMAVLFGPLATTNMLQHILKVSVSGEIDTDTTTAAATWEPRKLINALSVARIMYHANRVHKNRTQADFIVGWDARACEFIE